MLQDLCGTHHGGNPVLHLSFKLVRVIQSIDLQVLRKRSAKHIWA